MNRAFVALIAAVGMLCCSAAAFADDADVSTSIASQSGSPAALSRCRATHNQYFINPYANVVNRTKHDLITVSIQYRFYDQENSLIGQKTFTYTPGTVLTSGDTATFNGMFAPELSEPWTALASVTCRVMAATFTGHRSWAYGQHWPEKLLPIETSDNSGTRNDSNDGSNARAGSISSGRVQIAVTNAWNDRITQGLLVHVAVTLQGGAAIASVAPSGFVLTMALANGGKKSYRGLSRGAPGYQKYNALTKQTTIAYEVDPKDDLGKIGAITVPAHGVATVTVTFFVPDAVADPNANRAVSYL